MNSLMKLCIYSGSDSETEDEYEEQQESRLPLPDFLSQSTTQMISKKEENEDGKVRNFPHEPGNWATYIYLPMDSSELLKYTSAITSHFKALDLKPVDDFHISLTRTVILRHHWIQDFTKTVEKSLTGINPFNIYCFGLKSYANDQKTRSFLSLGVNEGEEDLKCVVSQLDNCLRDYSLQSYYENPSFHTSLLWCPGDKCNVINKYIESLPSKLKNFGFYKHISYCVCVSGNKKFNFYFNQ